MCWYSIYTSENRICRILIKWLKSELNDGERIRTKNAGEYNFFRGYSHAKTKDEPPCSQEINIGRSFVFSSYFKVFFIILLEGASSCLACISFFLLLHNYIYLYNNCSYEIVIFKFKFSVIIVNIEKNKILKWHLKWDIILIYRYRLKNI